MGWLRSSMVDRRNATDSDRAGSRSEDYALRLRATVLRAAREEGLPAGGRLEREPEAGAAAGPVGAVLQRQAAAVGFRNLTAQDEPDPGAARLRREERDEQVSRVRQPRALVLHPQLHRRR